MGELHGCGLKEDGSVSCWGAGSTGDDSCDEDLTLTVNSGQDQPPAGPFEYLASGSYHSCAVRTDGTIACWGAGTTDTDCSETEIECGQAMPPSEGGFVQVAGGFTHSCGLKETGKVVCWGSDSFGRSSPPPELAP